MHVSRNIISNFAASVWTAMIGIAVLPIYLQYIGVESYGLIGFLLTLQAWFMLLDMGVLPTASREMARFTGGQYSIQGIRNLITSLERVYLFIAVLLGLLLIYASRWLVTNWLQLQTLSADHAAQSLALMSMTVTFQWMGSLYRSAINGLQRQVWLSGLSVVIVILRAVVTLAVLAWISPTLTAFVLTQSATFLFEAAMLRGYLQRQLPQGKGQFSLTSLQSIWQFAAGLTGIAFLATLLTQVDKLLLSKLLTLEQFGYFSLSMTVVGALMIVVAPIFNAAYPRFTELAASGQHEVLAVEYHLFSEIATITLVPIAATFVLFSNQVVYAWTGNLKLTSFVAPIVATWTIGSALNALMHVPFALQLAVGWLRLSLFLNTMAVMLLVPTIIVFVPKYGIEAAAWIWAGINVCYFTLGTILMHRRVLKSEIGDWYLRDIGIPSAVAILTSAIFWQSQIYFEPMDRLQAAAFITISLVFSTLSAALSTSLGRKLCLRCIRTGQILIRN